MSCMLIAFAVDLFVSSPLFFPIVLESDVAQETDYILEDPSFAAKQPGKQTPLSMPISPILSPPYLH